MVSRLQSYRTFAILPILEREYIYMGPMRCGATPQLSSKWWVRLWSGFLLTSTVALPDLLSDLVCTDWFHSAVWKLCQKDPIIWWAFNSMLHPIAIAIGIYLTLISVSKDGFLLKAGNFPVLMYLQLVIRHGYQSCLGALADFHRTSEVILSIYLIVNQCIADSKRFPLLHWLTNTSVFDVNLETLRAGQTSS